MTRPRADQAAATNNQHSVEQHDRLVQLKQHHDPHNLFRANRNIRPQADSERRPVTGPTPRRTPNA
jgi:hypothetical protein